MVNLEKMITLQNHIPKQVLHVKLSPCFLDNNLMSGTNLDYFLSIMMINH